MALVSDIPRCDWWDVDYPITLMDQFFADVLKDSDLKKPTYFRGYAIRPRTAAKMDATGKSEVRATADSFKLFLDVSQFKLKDIEVSIAKNFLVVHAKHEEKSEEPGSVSRELRRRYVLPRDCDQAKLVSKLSPEGTLVIEAPRVTLKDKKTVTVVKAPGVAEEDKKITAAQAPGVAKEGKKITVPQAPGVAKEGKKITVAQAPGVAKEDKKIAVAQDVAATEKRYPSRKNS